MPTTTQQKINVHPIMTALAAALPHGPWEACHTDRGGDPLWPTQGRIRYVGTNPDWHGAELYCESDRYQSEGRLRWTVKAWARIAPDDRCTSIYDVTATRLPEITCTLSPTKSTAQLVKDVTKRILDPYLPLYARALQASRDYAYRVIVDNALATTLAEQVTGQTPPPPKSLRLRDDGAAHRPAIVWVPGLGHVEIQNNQIRCESRRSYTPDQIQQLLALVASWGTPQA